MSPPTPLTLRVLPGTYSVWRLAADAPLPAALLSTSFLAVTRTDFELSIVCDERLVPEGARREDGWKCVGVEGTLPFSAIGVLASLALPLAQAGVAIFAASTFDTDYLLVRAASLTTALGALSAAGHAVRPLPVD